MTEAEFIECKKTHSVMHVKANGDRVWRKDGKLYRTNGPALECNDGDQMWYVNDKLHRIDGPAIECNDGGKSWYVRGEPHRIDGPAIEYAGGYKAWYLGGKLHRVDGPARVYADGGKEWWVDGIRMSADEFHKHTSTRKDVAAATPMSGWTIQDVQAFLLSLPTAEITPGILQRAADAAQFHEIDGKALQQIDTIRDVQDAFNIQKFGDCLKLRGHIRNASTVS